MSGLSQLGMTDVASRSRATGAWKLAGLVALGLVILVIIRNYLFVQAGMLQPNFEVIHAAYDFNLWWLPWAITVIAVIFMGLGVTWRALRRSLFSISLLYLFIAVDIFALRHYITNVEPEHLVVKQVRLETPKLDRPVRILHITDIQAGNVGDYQRAVFEQIKALNPDLILNTGDFLQVVPPATFDEEWDKLFALIKEVNPRYGTYAVYGDTEMELYRFKPDTLKPLVMLLSKTANVPIGERSISLHGLSLTASKSEEWAIREINQWLEESTASDFRILLGHAPDYSLAVGDMPIDLCLAGHTHGGQVRLPWFGPLVFDSAVPKEWARGFRRIGIPYLNVSAGAGSNRYKGLPPMRFNCPTEMTLIELVPIRPIR